MTTSTGIGTDIDDDDDSYSSDNNSSGNDGTDGGFGGPDNSTDYGGIYKGSLITRKKPSKPKKMKRGGLASKK